MIKRIWLCILTIIIVSVFTVAFANGLFPSMDEMMGTAMPSVGLTIGREPDEQIETDTGEKETYLNFSGEDYTSFGQYLAGMWSGMSPQTVFRK